MLYHFSCSMECFEDCAMPNVHRIAAGTSRSRLHIAAGLNYPHMPNRMRRQIQEAKYTVQLYIARLAHFVG